MENARKPTKYCGGWDLKTKKVQLAAFLGYVGRNSASQCTLFRVDSGNPAFRGAGNHLEN